MSSPVGHSLIGLALGLAAVLPRGRPREWLEAANRRKAFLLAAIVAANAPDVDYLPGILVGRLNEYHAYYTHTIGWVTLLAVGIAVVWKSKVQSPRSNVRRLWTLDLGLWTLVVAAFSHLLADFFTQDGKAPYGIMALWPFTDRFFIAPVQMFWRWQKADWSDIIHHASHNLAAAAMDVVFLLPVFVVLFAWKSKSSSSSSSSS